MTTLIEEILKTSRSIKIERDEFTVLAHTMEEVGELATEITIALGTSYKTQGPDGVIGESIDGIICLVDMIHTHAKHTGIQITEQQLIEIAKRKLAKWESKCQHITSLEEHSKASNANLGQTLIHKIKQFFTTMSK